MIWSKPLIQAVNWIAEEQEPKALSYHIDHYRDKANVGWVLVTAVVGARGKSGGNARLYIASPTGRVWEARLPWDSTQPPERVEPPIRNESYSTA